MTGTTQRAVALGDLSALVGERVGVSNWTTVDQQRIDTFAGSTGDHQWIHVDEVLVATGPLGTTIAHGYLVLSLAPMLLWDVLEVTGASQVINCGMQRVRFPTPVPAGSRLRMSVDLVAVTPVSGALHVT